MIFLQGFIKFDQGISEKSDGQNCAESGIIRIIIRRRRNRAKVTMETKKGGFKKFLDSFHQTS
jgi:hypothetical protein